MFWKAAKFQKFLAVEQKVRPESQFFNIDSKFTFHYRTSHGDTVILAETIVKFTIMT